MIEAFRRRSHQLRVLLHERVQLCQFVGGHFLEYTSETILPLVAVAQDGELEQRRVKQDELNVNDSLFLLNIISDLGIPRKYGCWFTLDDQISVKITVEVVRELKCVLSEICEFGKKDEDLVNILKNCFTRV